MQGVSVHEPAKLTDATHVKVACLRTLPGILLHWNLLVDVNTEIFDNWWYWIFQAYKVSLSKQFFASLVWNNVHAWHTKGHCTACVVSAGNWALQALQLRHNVRAAYLVISSIEDLTFPDGRRTYTCPSISLATTVIYIAGRRLSTISQLSHIG